MFTTKRVTPGLEALFGRIFRDVEKGPVYPTVDVARLTEAFSGSIREEGVGLEGALDELVEKVLPASMGVSNPMYFGLLNCSPLPAAPLADLLVSSLNNNAGALHQGPSAWAAENEVIRAFSELVYPDGEASGMILPGGTFANLQGLLVARARFFPGWDRHGPMTLERVPRVYTAASSHFSVARSARIAGLGPVVPVATTARGAMDPRALQERIEEDLEEGAAPFAVIGTAGSTVTGSIDPLAEIAEICRTHGLWLHVDACYGGAALLIDEQRALFSGIEHANSVALDPHKWFFCPLTASIFLVREKGMDLRTFDCEVSYIPKDPGDESASAWRRGIPTSRRATGITVWMTLRAHGWKTVRTAVRRNIELTRALERRFRDRGFEVLPDGELSIACARFAPTGWTEDEIDQLQNRVAADVSASGAAWFGTVRHQDRTWLCFRLTNLYTREEHIERLVEMVVTTAESQAR